MDFLLPLKDIQKNEIFSIFYHLSRKKIDLSRKKIETLCSAVYGLLNAFLVVSC
jgi:hypothetical protein